MTDAKKPMQSQEPPQSLPQDKDLAADEPLNVETPQEKLKRIEREGELNKVPPEPDNKIGPDTTGVGQPTAQPVKQGQSLPPTAIPVEKKFEGKSDQFYDPMDTERAINKKERAARGGEKADFDERD